MSGMNQVVATFWTFLLLAAFLCEPALSKGGRGGPGAPPEAPTPAAPQRESPGRRRLRWEPLSLQGGGRTSPVRVASAAAAGAAVALSADKWYASAYRRSNADISDDDLDFFNRTNNFYAQMSGTTQNGSSLSQLVSIIIATFSPKYGLLLDSIL